MPTWSGTPRMKRDWSTWIWLGWKWRLSSSEYRGGSAIDEGFETVTASCPIPIVMAGAKKIPELDALTMADNIVQQGTSGVDTGRNIS